MYCGVLKLNMTNDGTIHVAVSLEKVIYMNGWILTVFFGLDRYALNIFIVTLIMTKFGLKMMFYKFLMCQSSSGLLVCFFLGESDSTNAGYSSWLVAFAINYH